MIISEAAMNHFGSLPLMWKIIESSIESGADFVKFQLINEPKLYAPGNYDYGSYDIDDVRWLRRYSSVEENSYNEIIERVKSRYRKNLVSATPFDHQSLEHLISTEPPFIKIASGDNNYFDLVDEIAKSGYKVIVSTGMSSLKQVDNVVNRIIKYTSDMVLMHCVAHYPHNMEDAMLGAIPQLKERYGVEIGYSDHSLGYGAAVLAASMGVEWFEKHFTLSKYNGGLDAKHSLESDSLSEYCQAINSVQQALAGKRIGATDEEVEVAKRARRGVYYNNDLKVGHRITYKDLVFLRPEREYSLEEVDTIVGLTLKKDIKINESVSIRDLSQ